MKRLEDLGEVRPFIVLCLIHYRFERTFVGLVRGSFDLPHLEKMKDRPEMAEAAPARAETVKDSPVLDGVVRGLKTLFDSTLAEPIPESFNALLDQLDEKWEGQDDG